MELLNQKSIILLFFLMICFGSMTNSVLCKIAQLFQAA